MSDGARWIEITMGFRFLFGEMALGTRVYPVALRDGSFIEFAPTPDALELPRTLDDRVYAYVVMSQPVSGRLAKVSLHKGTIRYVPHQYAHHLVRFSGSFEDYLKKQFSGQARNGLKRKVRKYCDHVKDQNPWREYRTPEEVREFYNHARQISARTYQEKLLHKGLTDGAEDEWAKLAQQGIGRGYLLFDGAKPVAYMTGELRNGILLNDFQGFDPEYRNWSPGTVLQYFALQKLYENPEGARIWDFGEGEGTHKAFFANEAVQCADVFHFPPTARALALFSAQAGLHFASRGVVRLLDRYGLKDKVKRVMRRRASGGVEDSAEAGQPAKVAAATGGGESA